MKIINLNDDIIFNETGAKFKDINFFKSPYKKWNNKLFQKFIVPENITTKTIIIEKSFLSS